MKFTPNNDTDKAILELLGNKDELPSLKFITELAQELDKQVNETVSQVGAVTEEPVDFTSAQETLGESFDLEAILTRASAEYKRWGLGEFDLEEVKARLTFSPLDLERLKENPKLGGEVHLQVLDVNKTVAQNNQNRLNALEKIIGPIYRWTGKNLSELFVVDGKGNKAKQIPSTNFEIVFTPSNRDLTGRSLPEEASKYVGINARKQREHMESGVRFISPDVWMDMFNRGLDQLIVDFDEEIENLEVLYALDENEYAKKCQTALKNATDEQITQFLPEKNSETATQFPDLAAENGVVPSLCFGLVRRNVILDCCAPGCAFESLGSRRRFG